MHQIHHAKMLRRAAETIGFDQALIERMAEGAKFPDAVDDLYVVLAGKRLFDLLDHHISCFGHFGRWAKGVVRGYCWPEDISVKAFNVPNVDVLVDTDDWVRTIWPLRLRAAGTAVGWGSRHPHIRIVAEAPSRAIDEVEYASHVSMAVWVDEAFEELLAAGELEAAAFAFAVRLHYLHDACTQPHGMRVLLRGHTSYESTAYDHFLHDVETGSLPYLPRVKRWPGIENAVVRACREGVNLVDSKKSADLAYRWTLSALVDFRARLDKAPTSGVR